MEEDFHNCSMCSYSCTDANLLVKHTVREHKYDPNFRIHCTICGTSFDKYNSFQKHVKRNHTGDIIVDPPVDRENGEDQLQQFQDFHINPNADPNPLANSINLESEGVIEEDTDHGNINKMQWYTARFILNLKEKCRVTQVAVNDTLDATKDLVDQVVTVIKKRLQARCLHENINFSDIANNDDGEESDLFDTSFLFDHVNSQYLQNKFFKENFNLVVSINI